ncbi:MAG: 3-isopropylmalate dehydratase small subunit [Clostridia bacterium]|nr:3-isopropylmalate dehydratase small subunit [Clostridia bacterium]
MGKVYKYGDHIDTDVIIPARYLNVHEPNQLAAHCMEDIDFEFKNTVKVGDVIIAGENFGCGSSREHAPIAIKASGIQCVIAKSFARIFLRNAFNIGLPVIESDCAYDEFNEKDEIEVDYGKGWMINKTTQKQYKVNPLPAFMMHIVEKGGLMNSIREER